MKTLAILDYEKEYVNRLMQYMNQKRNFDFQVIAFTEEEKLKSYETDHTIDILLCSEDIAEISASEYKARQLFVLSDYNFVREGAKYPSIFKYQSADEIITEILYHFSKNNEEVRFFKSGSTDVIGICSASGGCYKSTFALAAALHHAKTKNTLFVSFDPFYSIPELPREELKDSLSDILYYLKQSNGSLTAKIKSVIRKLHNLDVICGVAHWIDLYDFTMDEAKNFLVEIMEHMSYQTIVIDIGYFGVNAMELMAGCSSIYVPVREHDFLNRAKEMEWKRQISFIGGEHLFERFHEIQIPYDSRLDGKDYKIEDLEEGVLGDYISQILSIDVNN